MTERARESAAAPDELLPLYRQLVQWAGGASLDEAVRASAKAMGASGAGLAALRSRADILAAGATAPPWLRPLGTELFRSQCDFNHAVVDVLEDLPWLASRESAPTSVLHRLARWERFRAAPPRREGLRGAAVQLAKHAALLVSARAQDELLRGLALGNRWVGEALAGLATGQRPARQHPFRELTDPSLESVFRPWLEAQLGFLEAFEQLLENDGRVLASRAEAQSRLPRRPPSSAPHPSVTVLAAGAAKALGTAGALEVLYASAPPPGEAGARQGDVADAQGELLVHLAAGDELLPEGLAALASAFADPAVDLAYGDAQFLDRTAAFRPGWSPETLWSWSYVGGTFAVRTRVAKEAQLSRKRPALEWLLLPRFSERQVVRVPRFVTRGPPPHPAVSEATLVEADLKRRGASGFVRLSGQLREVHLAPRPGTRVSIVVPFRDRVELLRELWASLTRHDPGVDWHLLLANNGSTERKTARWLRALQDPRVHCFDWNQPFNYSAINNAAAAMAQGDLLLFLNNDVEVRHPGWLADLAGYAQLPEVGVVGARLSYPDGSTQHAGVVIGLKGLAGHVFARWRPEYGPTPFGPPNATRNWSAVTGACLMLRREVFDALGGFDERHAVSGGDVALCLKAREKGLRVVCVGHVELSHHESLSRGRDPVPRADVKRELLAYRALLEAGDPLYHPLLSTEAAHGGPGLYVEPPAEHAVRALLPWL